MADPKPPTPGTPHPPPPMPPARPGRMAARDDAKRDPATAAKADEDRTPTATDVEPIMADPIQVGLGALHPPAVIDESLVPQDKDAQDESDEAYLTKHRAMAPSEPDPATVTGAEQNRFEVLTGKRIQREGDEKADKKAKADKNDKNETKGASAHPHAAV